MAANISPFINLPCEIVLLILDLLPLKDFISIALSCRQVHAQAPPLLIKHRHFLKRWRTVCGGAGPVHKAGTSTNLLYTIARDPFIAHYIFKLDLRLPDSNSYLPGPANGTEPQADWEQHLLNYALGLDGQGINAYVEDLKDPRHIRHIAMGCDILLSLLPNLSSIRLSNVRRLGSVRSQGRAQGGMWQACHQQGTWSGAKVGLGPSYKLRELWIDELCWQVIKLVDRCNLGRFLMSLSSMRHLRGQWLSEHAGNNTKIKLRGPYPRLAFRTIKFDICSLEPEQLLQIIICSPALRHLRFDQVVRAKGGRRVISYMPADSCAADPWVAEQFMDTFGPLAQELLQKRDLVAGLVENTTAKPDMRDDKDFPPPRVFAIEIVRRDWADKVNWYGQCWPPATLPPVWDDNWPGE